MIYKLVVYGFDSGLNELLNGRLYDYRTKKYRNPVKTKNDEICTKAIRYCRELRGVRIENPVIIHYRFYCKNKRRDRMNVCSAFDKSFQDSLQLCNIIQNDGWEDVLNITHEFFIDKENPRVVVEIEEIKKEGK